MRVLIIGFGVVGQSFAKLLDLRSSDLARTYGLRPRLVAVADRGGAAIDKRGLRAEELLLAKKEGGTVAQPELNGRRGMSGLELIEEVEAEVVVEATPTNSKTGEPGLSHIKAALKKGNHVITTNKGPLALALPALIELAQYNRVHLKFSGTVGGGTPVLQFAKNCLLGDKIVSIRGILNGTTNYILTRMAKEEIAFDAALAEAQRLGYAEADPSMDIDGIDTASKLVILANWAMGLKVRLKDVKISGIRNITVKETVEASRKGEEIKLVGAVDGGLSVKPQPIPKSHPLCVGGVLNAVTFTSQFAGEETIVGRGAGGMETASAILRDLIEIKMSLTTNRI